MRLPPENCSIDRRRMAGVSDELGGILNLYSGMQRERTTRGIGKVGAFFISQTQFHKGVSGGERGVRENGKKNQDLEV